MLAHRGILSAESVGVLYLQTSIFAVRRRGSSVVESEVQRRRISQRSFRCCNAAIGVLSRCTGVGISSLTE
jgi:hypothetical protein